MLVHRFGRSRAWAALCLLAALALCCACGTSRKPPAADGGEHHDSGSVGGKEAHQGESGKAGEGPRAGSGGKAGRSGSGGASGAASGGGAGAKAGSGGASGQAGACDAGCANDDGSVEGGEWPDAGCTLGQNQTCNDSPTMSAFAGTCSKDGTCFCMPGFAIRLSTGKCAAYTPKPGDACERNAGCNDNPISAARTGVCLSDGSCHCLGTAVKNPDTGLCKAP